MTDPLPCPTPKSGEIEAERSGGDSLLILRHKLHMGDLGTGPVFDALASLETLIKYGRWQVGRESMSHHPTLPSAVANASSALDAALLALRAAPASPAGENGRGPDETWHERFMRLGAARDYAGALAMLRSPVGASPSGVSDEGPGIHNENKAEDLQRLRAALEHIAEACDTEISAVKLLEGCRQIASQALSSVVGEGEQGSSVARADMTPPSGASAETEGH